MQQITVLAKKTTKDIYAYHTTRTTRLRLGNAPYEQSTQNLQN